MVVPYKRVWATVRKERTPMTATIGLPSLTQEKQPLISNLHCLMFRARKRRNYITNRMKVWEM